MTNGLAFIVPSGKRAISIPVDDVSGVAGLLKPGDRVDVVAVVPEPDATGQKETPTSFVIMQNISILAVNGKLEEEKTTKKEEKLAQGTVTLAVTPEESRRLLLANQKGVIRLMLRSPVDKKIEQSTPFKPQDFLNGGY
jgi:pilus assembly protein CpaB